MSHRRYIPTAVFLACLLAFALPTRAAVNMFLKVEGVKGDATDKAHAGWIEVLSFSTGVTQQGGAAHVGSGAGAGKVEVAPISITKYVDGTSPQLFLHACSGKHLKQVVLEVTTAGAKEQQQPMLRYTLDDALVSAVRTSGAAAGDSKPVEEVQITFSKIRMEVMSIDPKGGSKPAGDAGWDLKANQKVEGSTAGTGDATASSTPPAPAGQSDTTAAGSTATAAPAGGTAAPAPAPAPAEPAGTTARPLTRAQRERLKLRQAAEPQPAPAPAK